MPFLSTNCCGSTYHGYPDLGCLQSVGYGGTCTQAARQLNLILVYDGPHINAAASHHM